MRHSMFKHDDGGDIFVLVFFVAPLLIALLLGAFLHSKWFNDVFLPWVYK